MASSQKSIKEFALIGFILLGVLFGMTIMSFVFGNLSSVDYLEDATQTVTNESGAWINETGYTVSEASKPDFTGGVAITSIYNNTDGVIITSGNYTVTSLGVITNASTTNWFDVNVSYTSTYKTEAEIVSDETINQSLRAIGKYSDQSGTQFTTLGIAITLILLVAVFLFFWKSFMGKKEGSPGSFS